MTSFRKSWDMQLIYLQDSYHSCIDFMRNSILFWSNNAWHSLGHLSLVLNLHLFRYWKYKMASRNFKKISHLYSLTKFETKYNLNIKLMDSTPSLNKESCMMVTTSLSVPVALPWQLKFQPLSQLQISFWIWCSTCYKKCQLHFYLASASLAQNRFRMPRSPKWFNTLIAWI